MSNHRGTLKFQCIVVRHANLIVPIRFQDLELQTCQEANKYVVSMVSINRKCSYRPVSSECPYQTPVPFAWSCFVHFCKLLFEHSSLTLKSVSYRDFYINSKFYKFCFDDAITLNGIGD